jgi:ribosomal protein L7/L12
MRTLQITGWREGLLKISMNDVLREHLSLSLTEAKSAVDSVVGGKPVSFTLEDSIDAAALRAALERVGAIVEITENGDAPCVSSNGET